MNLKKLYTKGGEHSNPLSLFRNFDFFHTLCVIFVLSDYRKFMKGPQVFLKVTKDCYALQI